MKEGLDNTLTAEPRAIPVLETKPFHDEISTGKGGVAAPRGRLDPSMKGLGGDERPGENPRPGDSASSEGGAGSARAHSRRGRAGDSSGSGEVLTRGAWCVVWVPPADRAPVELVESLSKRGVRVEVRRDAFSAMSGACVLAKRTARDEPFIVIFAHPERLSGAPEVYEALQRCVPRANCWWYGVTSESAGGGEGMVRAVSAEDVRGWCSLDEETEPKPFAGPGSTMHARGEAGSVSQPRLRLTAEQEMLEDLIPPVRTGGAGGGAVAAGLGEEGGVGRSDILSAEELAMLLRENPEDDGAGPPTGSGGGPKGGAR